MSLELEIQKIIEAKFAELNRPDLIRKPIVAFSSAHDPKFEALKEIVGPWHQLPTDFLPEAESVISYFIPFTKEVALGPKNEPDGCPVWSEAYILINQHFHVVNQAVQDYLESQGYAAAQIRPPKAYDPETFHAVWSHRSAAVIAGLAAFGANNLAITDKGSGGRFCRSQGGLGGIRFHRRGAGAQAQHHAQCQKQTDQLFHVLLLLCCVFKMFESPVL